VFDRKLEDWYLTYKNLQRSLWANHHQNVCSCFMLHMRSVLRKWWGQLQWKKPILALIQYVCTNITHSWVHGLVNEITNISLTSNSALTDIGPPWSKDISGVPVTKEFINTFAARLIQTVHTKTAGIACGFAMEFLRSGQRYRPSKRLKRFGKSSSLHSKKNFLVGGCRFLWVTS